MRTKVTRRGQVSIPSAVRRQLRIKPESAVEWVIEGNAARVIPIPDDPAAALRGSGKKGEVARLIADRRRDRRRDAR
jgi:AbrB family looped-hinge helix DNA binding protein